MLFAHRPDQGRHARPRHLVDLSSALWTDLCRPLTRQSQVVTRRSLTPPTPADIEMIEIANQLCRDGGADCMTGFCPAGWKPGLPFQSTQLASSFGKDLAQIPEPAPPLGYSVALSMMLALAVGPCPFSNGSFGYDRNSRPVQKLYFA